ncbi:multiple sugar transport system permease protein [Paenibacillus sp. V4I3]|uniref:carbohydrate ABC transporter permease n=1 Tax=unclassified Paenibacillus TaxID=185978 RepID=UPI00277E69AF|nr:MULTISPECIES: carbohydrate ABC transporter permease [unclassified Paenibacillus]MDQ0877088.1 multiple sugar transport system permease protein [Paenibacillus sp. V4I3]MDQ0887031.1 multiple sugar transport system permease protein [Paenibacillus sp. V4I9]
MKRDERGIISPFDMKKGAVKAGYTLMVLLMIIIGITTLYPFFNTFFGSLKTREEFFAFPPTFFPKSWIWTNYNDAWNGFDLPLLTFLKNTIFIYMGNVVCSLLLIGLAAYALSHLRVPFKRWVTLFFLATLLIPPATYIVPNFMNLKSLGMINTYWAFWLPAAANAYFMLLLKNFFDGIHKEILEAARIDGASEFNSFIKIAVPLSTPIIGTLLILSFSTTWNEFYWPSIVMTEKEMYPLATGIYRYVVYSTSVIPWSVRFAILTMAMLPPVVFFLIFQKFIIRGLTVSSVKG